MRFATLKDGTVAAVKSDDGLVSLDGVCGSMLELAASYEESREAIERAVAEGTPVTLDATQLAAPVPAPSKIWAAAGNYHRGSANLANAGGRGQAGQRSPDELLEHIFLKPPSAVVGPGDDIVIPANAETIFPELELCVVIGRECRDLSEDEALDAVFGYSVILDVTARGYGSGKNLMGTRCVRKGFDTFAPVGPWIVTRDEIPDPQALEMRLWVNDDLRQSAGTGGMINGVARLVSYLSQVGTLKPGDLIASGNPDSPDFQQQLAAGDELVAEIAGVGQLRLGVARAG
ncbi:MAG: fumarylacetoacetate hydrolase family protein [Deltaproteobacteria bacterium]|nr:fumarylacetoacetate hydrolase family protein [Deltaproteobacteria bacterium]